MEEADEKVAAPVRRTRSAAKVATPPAKSSRPKPLSRKTRKKVVMMEVEVSDDEDEDNVENEKKNEVSNDDEESGDKKSEVKEEKPKKLEEEILELNGGSNNNESKELEDPVVMNDVNMFEEELDSKTESNEASKETVQKMEVDTEEFSENKRKKPEREEEPEEKKTKSDNVVENKQKVCDDSEEPEKKKPKIETSDVKTIEKKVEVKVKPVEEVKEKKVGEVKEKKVEEVKEKKVEEVKEKKVEEVKEKKVEEVKEKKVEKVKEEKVVEVKETKVEEVKEGKVEEVREEKVEEVKKEEKIDEVKDDKPKETKITKPDTVDKKSEKKDDLTETEEKIKVEDENKPEEKVKTEDEPEEKIKTQEKDDDSKSDTKDEDSKSDTKDEDSKSDTKDEPDKQKADPDAENISEDELPVVQAVKVPEAEEVSDEELPGPKRAELPADTEVVSEDELPTVKNETKKETGKRKLNETDYDPGSPTSECEVPAKKVATDAPTEKEKEEPKKPKKLPELDKYWKAVNDDPTDFTGWTYLLQYVDQENDMEAAREAYDAFLSHYPYCYGYWRKYADYEKRKGNKKKCEEVFDRGLKAISLSVDLWIHYLTYVKATRAEDEEFIRSQFERALAACGLEFRSDRLWDSFIKWETEGKRLQRVTAIYDRLLSTPTQGYTSHFDNFQEHVASNPPNKVIELDEFLALRKEVRQALKHDVVDAPPADSDAPPGDEDQTKVVSSDEESKAIKERIVSIRRKVHKATVNAVTSRWNYEEGIKRPYFHVKPLERCQLKNWHDYLDYETEQGDRLRIIVLFERCLIACALYEEFWLKFVHYLEGLKDAELQSKIRDVYERACTIHHLKKPNLHLQWAMFEETVDNFSRAAEILVNLEKSVPNVLQIAYRRVNLERRRGDHEKCTQLYEHYITNSKNKMISSSVSIKYSRFCFVVLKDIEKAQEILKASIAKDPNNPRLYLQLIDLTLQKAGVTEKEIIEVIDLFLEKDSTDPEQKVLFAQRKLEYLEDFGGDVQSVQSAHEQYQKLLKLNKDIKKKEPKVGPEPAPQAAKSKEKPPTPSSAQSGTYGNYGQYGNSGQPNYPYSGNQQGPNYYPPQYGQGDQQYQYQNWQYPQGGYGGYNQWGGYTGGGYGY